MILKDLIYQVCLNRRDTAKVLDFIADYYGKPVKTDETNLDVFYDTVGYLNTIKELLLLKHNKPKEPFNIIVELIKADGKFSDEDYYDVHGKKPNDDTTWAIEFEDWKDWLGWEVKNPEKLPDHELLGHILWEMTFVGFSRNAVNKRSFNLRRKASAIMKDTFNLKKLFGKK